MSEAESVITACQVDWQAMGPEGRAAFAELIRLAAQAIKDRTLPGMEHDATRPHPAPYEARTPGLTITRRWFVGRWAYRWRCACGGRGYTDLAGPERAERQGREHWKRAHRDTATAP